MTLRHAAFEKSTFFRFIIAVVLALAAVGLFIVNHAASVRSGERHQKEITSVTASIDRDVDTILARYEIEKSWMKKRVVDVEGSNVGRIERRILLPPDVQSVQINLSLNAMAKRYRGRAVASENLKENIIAIHIEVDDVVVETIILKPTKDLRRRSTTEHEESTPSTI
jgi:hypothetical protein